MQKFLYSTLLFLATIGIVSPVFALTVSPARIEISGDPGTTLRGEIELFNEQEGTRIFFTTIENFEPRGDSGAPYFVGDKKGLATWIEADDKISVESGERILVSYSISIPQNTEPGGYFSAIFFGSQPPKTEGGGEIVIGGKIGVLILLRVNGDIPEGGGLLDFNINNQQKLFTALPVMLSYRINNTGGDRVVPRGEIKIKNTFRLTSATLLANESEGSVLPNSTRKFETIWGEEILKPEINKDTGEGFFELVSRQWKAFHFGWYTAELSVSWGSSNQTATANYSFFVLPWQILTVIFVTIGVIGIFLRIMLKKYNRFIITQAMNR